jgi:hypothetical protein
VNVALKILICCSHKGLINFFVLPINFFLVDFHSHIYKTFKARFLVFRSSFSSLINLFPHF